MFRINGYWRVGLVVLGLLGVWGAVRPGLLPVSHGHRVAASVTVMDN